MYNNQLLERGQSIPVVIDNLKVNMQYGLSALTVDVNKIENFNKYRLGKIEVVYHKNKQNTGAAAKVRVLCINNCFLVVTEYKKPIILK